MPVRISLLSLAVVLAASPAYARDIPETPDDTIVVTANRSEQPLDRVGQSISILDAEEIEIRQTQAVADLLRTLPGVTVTRNGGVGAVTSVSIRGADGDQTVALIDGVKLNDPSSPGGGFNFGNLLVGNIQRIEVLRGPSSILWGSQAIGGVVNLLTAPPTEALAVNARAEAGWRNTGQAVANISGKAGPLSASAGGGYFRSDGISAFGAGNERDGYRNWGANLNLNLALTDAISFDARGYYSDGRVEIDGFAAPSFAFGDTEEYSTTREFVGYAGLNAALFDGRFRNRLGFAYTDSDRASFDPAETFAGKGRNERLEYQGVVDIVAGSQATFGLERETSRFTSSSYGGPETRGRAQIDSVYGQLVATPIAGLTLTGGLRHDEHNRFGGATTAAASGVFSPNDGATILRASYSEGFKAPSLFQLQSEYGNQALRPERAHGWDAGLTQRLLDGAIEAIATYFRRDSQDLIVFVSCPAPLSGICAGRPSGTYDNIAEATSKGVEVALALQPVPALRIQGSYTHIDARNRSPGDANFDRRLARRPSDSVTTTVDYSWPFGLQTGATLTHVGTSFDNASNARRIEGYVLAELRAALPVTRNVELYGRVENLFDERYETLFRYGTPGRAAYGGVRVRY
ncbi:TonB-dependent receptor plug domain-containing protein [Sphingomonas qomolangmaensis]|uniref:TonB-dependent receptor n=1 Tax=Sphingomonas qomolangmaensis TaxID=2918765 RepID=A0ABY5L7A0_9SPHN|nr:TonB-dependent receptor [Sphingomonas qomolangmaensis]UUL82840.1 TonB-dependent receptor [Sphingomonas qomolangmaensis]